MVYQASPQALFANHRSEVLPDCTQTGLLTVSPVSRHVAAYTTPKEPLPTTLSVVKFTLLRTPLRVPVAWSMWPATAGSPRMTRPSHAWKHSLTEVSILRSERSQICSKPARSASLHARQAPGPSAAAVAQLAAAALFWLRIGCHVSCRCFCAFLPRRLLLSGCAAHLVLRLSAVAGELQVPQVARQRVHAAAGAPRLAAAAAAGRRRLSQTAATLGMLEIGHDSQLLVAW